jgi:hypothetical protein
MKIALVEATLPELRGGKMYQVGRGEGTNSPAAISRAFKDMFKKVKGKRVSVIKATITITNKADAAGNAVECGCSGTGICTVCGKDGSQQ